VSESEEINRREVAYRLFAAEFDDADYSYAESDEERAPNYVVTPTGARVNRVFVVGVLTEIEQVNEDVVRARVVDPTGAFVVYAGQYQPEALAALESAETPSFVAVTGKARTFSPDDSDVVYTSIRPETVSEVDADTRDRWVVTTAEQTVDRVATMAAAYQRVERDDQLRQVLESAGVDYGLAAGIPLALDHYGTSPAYLAAVRELALDAARVVSGDVESAGELELSPDQGGEVPLDFAADLGDVDVEQPEAEPEPETAEAEPATTEAEAVETRATESTEAESETAETTEDASEAAEVEASEPAAEDGEPADAEPASTSKEPDETATAETATADAETDTTETTTADADETSGDAEPATEDAASSDGEMYELSEDERQEVEENYDVGFSSGDEIPESGETDLDEPEPDAETGETAETAETNGGDDEADDLGDFDETDEAFDESQEDDADDLDDFTEDAYDESSSDREDDEAGSMELDLEDYVVDLMGELDDGDGASRESIVATAVDEHDVDEGEVEDAIQSALMSGRCYESGDDHLKAI
jgi:hypothetical protein